MTESQDSTRKMRGLASSQRLCLSCSRTFEPGKFNMALSGTEATCPHDGTVLMPLPEIDAPLVGNYLYKGLLGVGGMGVVFKALNPYLDRLVAIKFVKGKRYDSKQLTRFMQEGKLLAKLVHPNLVSVLDFGANDIGEPYMVMEFLDGQSLAQMIEARRTIPLEEGVEILGQTCRGLAHAHKFGAVHRDIKPSNIFISRVNSREISVKLLDFGIAKLCFPEDPVSSADLTRTGEIFGSPLYMSPEQALGKTVDERSDIYNIGCVFYEMLTGAPPHVGKTAMETVFKHVSEEPEPLRQRAPKKNYPVVLEDLLTCLFAKDPDDRIESAEKLGQMFEAIGNESTAELRELSRRAKGINSQSTIGGGRGSNSGGRSGGPAQLSLGIKIAAAASVLMVAGLGAAYFIFRPPAPPKTVAPLAAMSTPEPANVPKKVEDLEDNSTSMKIFGIMDNPDDTNVAQHVKHILMRGNDGVKFEHLPMSKKAFEQIRISGTHLNSLELRACTKLTGPNLAPIQDMALTTLIIHFGDLDDNGLAAISKFSNVRQLALLQCHDLSPRGLASLKNMHLYGLHIEGTAVAPSVWADFLPRNTFTNLEFAGTTRTDLGEGVPIFPCRPAMPLIAKCANMHDLILVSTDIEDADMAKLSGLNNLARLSVARSRKISDLSASSILKLRNLNELDVSGTSMTAAGIERILRGNSKIRVKVSHYMVRSQYLESERAAGRLSI